MRGARGKTRSRLGLRVAALLAAGALASACGQILGLDDIAYDAHDGAVAERDASAPVDAFSGDVDGSPAADDSPVDSPIDSPVDSPIDAPTAPSGPVTVTQDPTGGAVLGLTIDDTRIYWVTAGASASVLSSLKDGGGLTTIATGQASPLDIAVQGTSVYWSVAPAGTGPQCMAMTASTPGGGDAGPSCVLSSPDVTVRMTLGGASIVLLAQGTGTSANNEYVGVPAAGGAFTNTQTQGTSAAIAATTQKAFLGNVNGPHVDELALTGLTFGTTICTTSCGSTPAVDMITDVSVQNVFWISRGGTVQTAPITVSGSVGTQFLQLSATPQRMARDASYIYLTAVGAAAQPPSAVYAVPITPGADAGAYLTLAAGENGPFGIAVDESAVYWGDAEGRIRKTAVP